MSGLLFAALAFLVFSLILRPRAGSATDAARRRPAPRPVRREMAGPAPTDLPRLRRAA